jgi:preprotein translocase subunit SecE
MVRSAASVLFVVLLAATIVIVDVLFFRSRFWDRLMANVGIVLVYCAFFLRFLNR